MAKSSSSADEESKKIQKRLKKLSRNPNLKSHSPTTKRLAEIQLRAETLAAYKTLWMSFSRKKMTYNFSSNYYHKIEILRNNTGGRDNVPSLNFYLGYR